MRSASGVVLGLIAGSAALAEARGQESGTGDTVQEKVDRLERENRELRERMDRLERGSSLDQELQSLGAPGTGATAAGQATPSSSLTMAGHDLSQSGLSQAFGGIYTKPFLTNAGNIAIGGYASWQYTDAENANRDLSFPRLIPFIYAQVTERVTFATEIEIEEGHELEVEFAFVDYKLVDAFNLRGGLILDPLGHFNLVHDDPVNELTDRPLVDLTIIPSALREVGAGAFGTLVSADSAFGRLGYEAYVTTGFRGLLNDGTVAFNTDTGLHDGKADEEVGSVEAYHDNNNNLATVGRLDWSPSLGATLGVSAHRGNYDESDDNTLLVLAVDGALDGNAIARFSGLDGAMGRFVGAFELLGEYAHADIQRDAFARSAGVPGDMHGWYGQVNYRIYPEFLRSLEEDGWVGAGSRFTFVVRRDEIDLDGFERERWTFGLNFRPNRYQTVVKLDYQINTESGDTPSESNDAFLLSIATYF
jgi:hypothetical protein